MDVTDINIKSCRICFEKIPTDDYYYLFQKDASYHQSASFLKQLIENFDTKLIFNPIACNLCNSTLLKIWEFQKMCSENQAKLEVYVYQLGTPRKLDHEDLLRAKQISFNGNGDECNVIDTKEIVVKKENCNDNLEVNGQPEENLMLNAVNDDSIVSIKEEIEIEDVKSSWNEDDNCERNKLHEEYLNRINGTKNPDSFTIEPQNIILDFIKEDTCLDEEKEEEENCKPRNINQSNTSYTCDLCKENFIDKSSLEKHISIHTYKCTKCPEISFFEETISKHITTHDSEPKNNSCAICNKSFNQSHTLKRHMTIHTGEKPHKCTICKKSFKLSHHLKRHMDWHSGQRPHECPICKKTFTLPYNLKKHKLIHTGERPYKCTVCEKSFRQSSILKMHLITHSGSRAFKCTVCTQSFTDATTLKKHAYKHTGDKPFECCICKCTFKKSDNLKLHQMIHTGEKPFKCGECGVDFRQSSALNKHMMTHTGERPFECVVCSRSFIKSSSLRMHMYQHTGEKPFECGVCKKRFGLASQRKDHERAVHMEERRYNCSVCEMSFKYRSTQRAHMMKEHTGTDKTG